MHLLNREKFKNTYTLMPGDEFSVSYHDQKGNLIRKFNTVKIEKPMMANGCDIFTVDNELGFVQGIGCIIGEFQ